VRIVIMVGGLPPLFNGGTEIATLKIAEYAALAGHEVHVLAADGSRRGKELYKRAEKGFRVHRIPTLHRPYWHGLSYLPAGIRVIQKLKPDIVHAQALYMAATALAARIMTGTPYMVYGRGGIYLNWRLKRFSVRTLLKPAERVIAQTEDMRQEMLKYIQRDIEVIPNGIDVDRFGKLSKTEARSILRLPQNKKIVLSVGRCRPEKNLRIFVEAALMDQSDTEYILVGDGTQQSELEKLANGRVRFTGSVYNANVPTYMSAADILVNTSLSEGFPVAVLEGMASGLPIVAPKVCGLPDIITDGINGILTIPKSFISTADAINALLRDESMTKRMSIANSKKAEGYTWEKVVKLLYG